MKLPDIFEYKSCYIATWLFTIFVISTLYKAEFSGSKSPPLYGDFEAQRHWLEITLNLPTTQWYRYDLDYWGLDYPPLTAYHSLLLGWIADWINPTWVKLDESRGNQSTKLVYFMRTTSLITFVFLYGIPLSWYCYSQQWKLNLKNYLFLLMLMQPSLILIDHGHFQYNSAMLGFTLMTCYAIQKQRWILSAVLFVLALCFKQMALYYSLTIFFMLLSTCYRLKSFRLLLQIACATLLTFIALFLPFLNNELGQVIHRLFPVSRGLFEDKVANMWCALNVLIKFKQVFTPQQLLAVSAGLTLACSLPSCLLLFKRPNGFLLSLVNVSLSFFLFSFQVHEKSILIPLLPATLLLHRYPLMSIWFNNIALFSMFPLLKKDGLIWHYFVLMFLWNLIAKFILPKSKLIRFSFLGMILLHFMEFQWHPPAKYPDLLPLLNACYSCAHFVMFLGYFYYQQFKDTLKRKEE